MPPAHPFALDTRQVGALPLVNHVLERLRFDALLERHLARPHPRAKVPAREALGVLVRNLVLVREPLYALGEWAQDRVPGLLGLAPEQVQALQDDRVGRALDRLFDADRAALLTDLVVGMVREFDVALDQLHNDSTTVTLQGEYADATGKRVRGKPTVRIEHGYNKDHRPDLKQILWILTVSADGAVPVHFKVADGSTEDTSTHVEIWETLRQLVGSPSFLYVADSKLCSEHTLRHIHREHGWFLTVMPRTRAEDGLFKDWLQDHMPQWKEVARRSNPRKRNGPEDVVRGCPSPIPDANGFRLLWYHSTWKEARDARTRREAIQGAWKKLEALRARIESPRSRFKKAAGVCQEVDAILEQHGADRWLSFEVTPFEEERYRQEKRGRPGKNTRWRRKVKTRLELTWALRQDQVDYHTRCDGIFPLVTNRSEDVLSLADAWKAYRTKQPFVEARHDLLKNVEAVTPMWLKSVSRIEALLFVEFVALLVHALVEREVRRAMTARGLETLPLYPEERDCPAPTARRIFELFEPLQRHLLGTEDGRFVQRFDPELDERQHLLLELLEVSPDAFNNL